MSWFIGRTEALSNPEKARRKALDRLRSLAELDDPESLVVPILLILTALPLPGRAGELDSGEFEADVQYRARPNTGAEGSIGSS